MRTYGQKAAAGETAPPKPGRRFGHVRWGLAWTTLALLLVIWVALPLVPEETGLRFGFGFRAFFSAAVLLSIAFFWLLDHEHVPQPKGTAGVLGSIALVYVLTVGFLTAVTFLSPQFGLPRGETEAAAEEATMRGEALFWKPELACFQCHTIGGRGGSRGPDLTRVGARAAQRVPGLTAEQYLREKVRAGAAYEFKVPGYVPMMPGVGQTLSSEQLDDLVAYLLSLK